jgi:sortase B
MKKNLRPLLGALCVVFLALVAFSGWKVYSILHGYKEAETRYNELAGAVVAPVSPAAALPSASSAASSGDEQGTAEPPQAAAPGEVSPVTVDFEGLLGLSRDVIGWLCLPNTPINYPLVQTTDNVYYLNRFLDGKENMGGSLFADCACPSDFSGRNTIIYGHNMRDGSMFALIDDYAEQSFFDAHPVMYLNTPAQNYRIDIFSGFTTDPESFVYETAFASDEDYAAFLDALLAHSEIDCGTAVNTGERIVTLSTCTYTGEDVRFVVCGKLTPIG